MPFLHLLTRSLISLISLLFFALSACAPKERNLSDKQRITTSDIPSVMDQGGNPMLANGRDIEGVNFSANTQSELEKFDNGAEGDLIFTDPDDPHGENEELNLIFASQRGSNRWILNYKQGIRRAGKSGKPLIIWFHNSVISPNSRRLGSELLDTPEFNEWCKDRVIRIKIDSGVGMRPGSDEMPTNSHDYMERLKNRYKLRQTPAFAVVAANGKIVQRIDGFDGFLSEVEIKLKNGVLEAEDIYEEYKAKLIEEKGYHEWRTAGSTHIVLGKITRYNKAKDILHLKEASGRQWRVKVSRLSQEDIDYFEELNKKKARRLRDKQKAF